MLVSGVCVCAMYIYSFTMYCHIFGEMYKVEQQIFSYQSVGMLCIFHAIVCHGSTFHSMYSLQYIARPILHKSSYSAKTVVSHGALYVLAVRSTFKFASQLQLQLHCNGMAWLVLIGMPSSMPKP